MNQVYINIKVIICYYDSIIEFYFIFIYKYVSNMIGCLSCFWSFLFFPVCKRYIFINLNINIYVVENG